MAVHPFNLGQLAAAPWKNGGGATREIACWPPGANMEQFDWRISVATIAQSGPFSRFPGVDRVITLLSGDGVRLQQSASGINHCLDQALQPFAFEGDGDLECELLGGTSTDFNLMLRRGRWRGAVQVLRSACLVPARPAGLLLAVRGHWAVTPRATPQNPAVRLAQDAGLWWADEDCGWSAAPATGAAEGVLLHVQLEPANTVRPNSKICIKTASSACPSSASSYQNNSFMECL